jgi:hypothetical protein
MHYKNVPKALVHSCSTWIESARERFRTEIRLKPTPALWQQQQFHTIGGMRIKRCISMNVDTNSEKNPSSTFFLRLEDEAQRAAVALCTPLADTLKDCRLNTLCTTHFIEQALPGQPMPRNRCVTWRKTACLLLCKYMSL